jgi:hypothetical protein
MATIQTVPPGLAAPGRIAINENFAAINAELGSLWQGEVLDPDILPPAEGENYLFVEVTTDPLQNGLNLIAACARAGTLTPNGLAIGSNNRVQVLLPPARYDLNTTGTVVVPSWVDVIGIGTWVQTVIMGAGTSDQYRMVSLSGNSRLRNLYIWHNSAGNTVNTSADGITFTDHAAALYMANFGAVFFEDCVISAVTTLSTASTNTSSAMVNCFITGGFRHNTLNSWLFEECYGWPSAGSNMSNKAFFVQNCILSSNTTFLRSCVNIIDGKTTAFAFKVYQCPYVGLHMTNDFAWFGDFLVSGAFIDCNQVAFVIPNGGTARRFIMNGTFRNCYINGLGNLMIRTLTLVACSLYYTSSTDALACVLDTVTNLKALDCQICRPSLSVPDMLFQPTSGTGNLILERCSLPQSFTLNPAWTLLSGATIADTLNFVSNGSYYNTGV